MNEEARGMDRRSFLRDTAVAATAIAGIGSAQAVECKPFVPDDFDRYDFLFARICNNNPAWDYGPGGDKNFLEQLSDVLRVKVKLQPNVRDEYPEQGLSEHFNALVDLSSIDEMRKFPMLFMTGMGPYRLKAEESERLKEYVCGGGFVLMDECAHPRRADEFYQGSYLALVQLFGQEAVRPIPEDHEVYRSVYKIGEPDFHRWKRGGVPSPGNTGVFIGDRLAVFLCDADIHCGWTDPRDSWIKRADNEEGIKTGINIVAYAMGH